MTKPAVILESDTSGVKEAVFAALTVAAEAGDVIAITTDDTEAVKASCAEYGVKQIINVKASCDLNSHPDARAAAIAECIKEHGITDVIAINSMEGKDLLARLAVLLDAAFVSDCLEIDVSKRTVKKSYFAGKALATLSVPGDIAFYGLRPNALTAKAAASMPTSESFMSSATADGIVITGIQGSEGNSTDLSEASVIVAGGRAVGDASGFEILNELASTLEAGVGASRAAVDAGYAAHSMQVGQTGKTVSPNLYIACGISGAVQHYAGMKTSKVIVAINNDKDAPIFSKCDYGIVGDIFDVVPQLTNALK